MSQFTWSITSLSPVVLDENGTEVALNLIEMEIVERTLILSRVGLMPCWRLTAKATTWRLSGDLYNGLWWEQLSDSHIHSGAI